jgi:DNA-binding transcriptional LysR family regulator
MNPNISTRQLQAFIALADQRSFTRAASQCHLSQPAFSALIRQLETSLGLKLFDRSTRHVDMTPEGHSFLESARRIRSEITLALASVRDAATLQRGRVAVALLPSLAAGWLPGVLAQYRTAHPGIEIDIADVLSEPCIDRVASGRADFALAAIRADTPALQAEPFCRDSFYLVCPSDHALARRKEQNIELAGNGGIEVCGFDRVDRRGRNHGVAETTGDDRRCLTLGRKACIGRCTNGSQHGMLLSQSDDESRL